MITETIDNWTALTNLKVSLKDPKLDYLHGIVWGLDYPHPDTLEIRTDTDQTEYHTIVIVDQTKYHAIVIDSALRKAFPLKDLIAGKEVGVIDRIATNGTAKAKEFFYKYNNKP